MKTIWGEQLDPNNVLQEYPRPQMARESYTNLNGLWAYAITATSQVPEVFDGDILVPFSPESTLSGVNRSLGPNEFLWYRRRFSLPQSSKPQSKENRTLLHFGAVDQWAQVFINGAFAGEHVGGYLPFTLDITEHLAEGERENELLVRVVDVTDTVSCSRGKQATSPGGIWYTAQSGIWQTVWLEQVPNTYICGLTITPRFDEAAVEITVQSAESVPCAITLGGQVYEGTANAPIVISMPEFTPWWPEQPHLYPFTATLGCDKVDSYFAMRKFSVDQDDAGIPRLFLNNKPYFHNGVLDQGYWPDGLYTAPSDAALIYDIQLMKDMGFNMLRKHIKIEPMRWYYHCDRMGMLVWQDMVNGGGRYRPFTISAPLILNNSHNDSDYPYFAREDESGREQYWREMEDTVQQLYNCPCIAMWVPFNEGWGQFHAAKAAERIKTLDATRTVDHASGWHDQGAGDVKSLHVYFKPYRFRPDSLGRPVALTEFGGYGCRIPGHCYSDKAFGYKRLATPEALERAYRKLYEGEILPSKAKGLCATVYTQLSDVETETNGFVTYDRRVVKLPVEQVKALNKALNDDWVSVPAEVTGD